jgi:hypothetical protein
LLSASRLSNSLIFPIWSCILSSATAAGVCMVSIRQTGSQTTRMTRDKAAYMLSCWCIFCCALSTCPNTPPRPPDRPAVYPRIVTELPLGARGKGAATKRCAPVQSAHLMPVSSCQRFGAPACEHDISQVTQVKVRFRFHLSRLPS